MGENMKKTNAQRKRDRQTRAIKARRFQDLGYGDGFMPSTPEERGFPVAWVLGTAVVFALVLLWL